MYRKRTAAVLIFVGVSLLLWGCAGGEGGPAQGTPEWYWQAALESYEAGDYPRAIDNLESITDAGDSPLSAKAHAWRLTLLYGLSRGYAGVWRAFDEGAEKSGALARSLQNPMQDSQRQLRRHAIALTESVSKTKAELSGTDTLVLDFPFPPGSPAMSPILASISGGSATPDNQVPMAQKSEVERGIIYAVSHLIGEDDDANGAKARFTTLPVEVEKEAFFFRLAEGMKDTADLFVQRHINDPTVHDAMMATVKKHVETAAELENEELSSAAKELLEEMEEEEKTAARRR